MDVDEGPDEAEQRRRLEERWEFDADDAPPGGPDGSDEQDRILIDDYETMYGRLLYFRSRYIIHHVLQESETYHDFIL